MRLASDTGSGLARTRWSTRWGPSSPEVSVQQSSVVTTGGVYNWQGRSRCTVMTCVY